LRATSQAQIPGVWRNARIANDRIAYKGGVAALTGLIVEVIEGEDDSGDAFGSQSQAICSNARRRSAERWVTQHKGEAVRGRVAAAACGYGEAELDIAGRDQVGPDNFAVLKGCSRDQLDAAGTGQYLSIPDQVPIAYTRDRP